MVSGTTPHTDTQRAAEELENWEVNVRDLSNLTGADASDLQKLWANHASEVMTRILNNEEMPAEDKLRATKQHWSILHGFRTQLTVGAHSNNDQVLTSMGVLKLQVNDLVARSKMHTNPHMVLWGATAD